MCTGDEAILLDCDSMKLLDKDSASDPLEVAGVFCGGKPVNGAMIHSVNFSSLNSL